MGDRKRPRRLRLVVEISSALAVVLSLIFVGVQVRQSAIATRGATLQSLSNSSLELSRILLENADIRGAVTKWRMGEELDEDEAYAANIVVLVLVRHVENTYDQIQLGAVARPVLDRWLTNSTFTSPNFPAWWALSSDRFGPEFGRFLERHLGLGSPAD